MSKKLLSGNEAVAQGAWEAGVRFGAAYPGTPSTEILEELTKYEGVDCQWSTNEKVALEVASGATFGGARAIACMKHVGINVAADPLFSMSYVGAHGGLVVVSADDPGMHSSQNEQDNRYYARAAKVPMLEPSDSQETRELTRIAFDLSEEYDTPVLLRLTTRICHSKGVVEVGPRVEHPPRGYSPQSEKRSLLPSNARRRHVFVEERTLKLRELTERFPYNRLEPGDPAVGIVSCGVAYQYAREVFPRATFLKLSLTWPLPVKLVKQFARKVKKIYVIEEGDPILENHLRQLGLKVTGKDRLPLLGEFSPSVVARAFGKKVRLAQRPEKPHIPLRPPVLCPGCGHRGVFYEIAKLKLRAMGDIGCYTLGAYPPLNAMDTCLCMGASLGNTLGLEKALGPDIEGRAVAVIGDSTFYHSGITPLIDIVYNKGKSTVVILDNQITAMTGHQHHPGSGKTLQGQPAPVVDLEALCRAVGVKHVRVVDPYDLPAVEAALREEVKRPEPSVIIARRPCVLMERRPPAPFAVLAEKCNACKLCLRVGCPAISLKDSLAVIDPLYCKGCAVCHQVCQKEAIVPA